MQTRPCAPGVRSGQTGMGLPGRRPFLPRSLSPPFLHPIALQWFEWAERVLINKKCNTCNRYHAQGALYRSPKVPFQFHTVLPTGLWDAVKIRKDMPYLYLLETVFTRPHEIWNMLKGRAKTEFSQFSPFKPQCARKIDKYWSKWFEKGSFCAHIVPLWPKIYPWPF